MFLTPAFYFRRYLTVGPNLGLIHKKLSSLTSHKPSMAPTPDLPILPPDESLLSQKFGRETANYFSGSPLNRLSFLRTDLSFLRSAFSHPSAAFVLLNNLAPLVQASDSANLAFATGEDVKPLTGADPFGKTEEEQIREYNSEEPHSIIVFLGIDEKGALSPHSGLKDTEPFSFKDFKGTPYFAIDATPREKNTDAANKLAERMKEKGFEFYGGGPRHMALHSGQGKFPSFGISQLHGAGI